MNDFFNYLVNESNETQKKKFEAFFKEKLIVEKKVTVEFEVLIKEHYNTKLNVSGLIYFDKMIERSSYPRVMILSAEAGAGKTVTFKQIALKFKRKNSDHWVSYIDLKDFIRFYNSDGFLEDHFVILENILDLNKKNQFERKIFKELFEAGKVVLLWNGFDEISPTYSDFVINLIKFVYENSNNTQYVCTRPLYKNQLETAFNVISYGFDPFSKAERKEFFRKYFTSKNASEDQIENLIEKVDKISSNYKYETPLMLVLIAEVHKNTKLFESQNLYQIYENFVSKKLEIKYEKGVPDKKIQSNALASGASFDMKKIHQKYALLTLYPHVFTVKRLKVMRTKFPKDFYQSEISRGGILFINSEFKFEFSHRTFAEFFVAQYLIENFFTLSSSETFEETVFDLVYNLALINERVIKFINHFPDTEMFTDFKELNLEIEGLLSTKHRQILFSFLYHDKLNGMEMLLTFFSKDQKLLTDLLHVNEIQTIYTEYFYSQLLFSIHSEKIKSLGQKYLIDERDFSNFLSGKNQNGTILFCLAWKKYHKRSQNHYKYDLSHVNVTEDYLLNFYKIFKENSTELEQKELLKFLLGSPRAFIWLDNGLEYYDELWLESEKLLNKSDVKSVAVKLFTSLNSFEYFMEHKIKLNFVVEKLEHQLSKSDFLELLETEQILHYLLILTYGQIEIFEKIWDYYSNHTNKERQKQLLLRDFELKSNQVVTDKFLPINMLSVISADRYKYKLFHIGCFYNLTKIVDIYKNALSQTELRNLILNSNDFVLEFIKKSQSDDGHVFSNFLQETFEGHEKLLVEFLTRKIKGTDLTIFNYFEKLCLQKLLFAKVSEHSDVKLWQKIKNPLWQIFTYLFWTCTLWKVLT